MGTHWGINNSPLGVRRGGGAATKTERAESGGDMALKMEIMGWLTALGKERLFFFASFRDKIVVVADKK